MSVLYQSTAEAVGDAGAFAPKLLKREVLKRVVSNHLMRHQLKLILCQGGRGLI